MLLYLDHTDYSTAENTTLWKNTSLLVLMKGVEFVFLGVDH